MLRPADVEQAWAPVVAVHAPADEAGRGRAAPDRSDVAPGFRSSVNESPHPARLGRGLHHETNPPHTRADHPQAQNR